MERMARLLQTGNTDGLRVSSQRPCCPQTEVGTRNGLFVKTTGKKITGDPTGDPKKAPNTLQLRRTPRYARPLSFALPPITCIEVPSRPILRRPPASGKELPLHIEQGRGVVGCRGHTLVHASMFACGCGAGITCAHTCAATSKYRLARYSDARRFDFPPLQCSSLIEYCPKKPRCIHEETHETHGFCGGDGGCVRVEQCAPSLTPSARPGSTSHIRSALDNMLRFTVIATIMMSTSAQTTCTGTAPGSASLSCQAETQALANAYTVDSQCQTAAQSYAATYECLYASTACSSLTSAVASLRAATVCSAFTSAYQLVCNEVTTCYAPPQGADPCFPGTALVTLADGTLSRIDALKEGTSILSATTEGGITTDTVTLLSIVKPEATAKFLTFTTANNNTLTLTPEHHLPVGPTCCSTIRKAKDVPIGATVWMVEAAELTSVLITSKEIVNAVGLHSPVLSKGGLPIVNGFVTSFDSIEKVTIARYGLTFLLKACAVTGTCEYLRSLFN